MYKLLSSLYVTISGMSVISGISIISISLKAASNNIAELSEVEVYNMRHICITMVVVVAGDITWAN